MIESVQRIGLDHDKDVCRPFPIHIRRKEPDLWRRIFCRRIFGGLSRTGHFIEVSGEVSAWAARYSTKN